jgi:hypothetical protein
METVLPYARANQGQTLGPLALLRAAGGVVGLLKSAAFTFVSTQLTVLISERPFELVPETVAGPAPP